MKNIANKLFISFTLGTLLFIPVLESKENNWNYDNYLHSLRIMSYDDPVTTGGKGLISVEIGANTDVVAHIEFKGCFPWGDWSYYSLEVPVDAGKQVLTKSVDVPIKTLHEPANYFYYYVYVTLPYDSWSPNAWGLLKETKVTDSIQPDFVIKELPYGTLVATISSITALVIIWRRAK